MRFTKNPDPPDMGHWIMARKTGRCKSDVAASGSHLGVADLLRHRLHLRVHQWNAGLGGVGPPPANEPLGRLWSCHPILGSEHNHIQAPIPFETLIASPMYIVEDAF